MPLKLLAIGDLHLGRAPSRLPDDLAQNAARLGPTGVWQRIVDEAIDARVDAVVLAGDVVEHDHDFFEAYRELHKGVSKLLAANIAVLAVAGNHDTYVLPRLADQLEGFDLVGRGGRWERRTLESGSERLTLHGWSFPQRVVTSSPLAGERLDRGPGPNLGVLHCDRDQATSHYAPVQTAELRGAGVDGWLLGHIHRPDALTADSPFGYLGSATGLHPNEHGPRGPWLIEVSGGQIEAVERWPLAPLHWQHLDINVTGIAAAEDAREKLLGDIAELDAELATRKVPPIAAGLRVRIVGRTSLRAQIELMLRDERLDDLASSQAGIRYFVESVRLLTKPEIDLDALAETPSPAGLLARRLQLLDRAPADAERAALIRRARERLEARHDKAYFKPLGLAAPTDAAVADWLREAALAALDALQRQQANEADP